MNDAHKHKVMHVLIDMKLTKFMLKIDSKHFNASFGGIDNNMRQNNKLIL